MERFLKIFCAIFVLCSSACTIDGRYGHVEKVRADVPASPDLHGAGHYQKPNTKYYRMAAKVHLGNRDEAKIEGIENELGDCGQIEHCRGEAQVKVREDVDAEYRMVYPTITASFERLWKDDLLLWSFGTGIDRGVYGFGTLGINTRHFELGAALGVWFMGHGFSYSGTEYDCVKMAWDDEFHLSRNSFESNSDYMFDLVFVYGMYASVYHEKFSFQFSAGAYRPHGEYMKDDHADFELPYVITEYFGIGYRINGNWEIHSGVANMIGDFAGWHFSGLAGVRFYWI